MFQSAIPSKQQTQHLLEEKMKKQLKKSKKMTQVPVLKTVI